MKVVQPKHKVTVAGDENGGKRLLHTSRRLSLLLQQLTTVTDADGLRVLRKVPTPTAVDH